MTVVPRASRMNLVVRLIMPWRLPACPHLILPLAVTLNRFLQLDLVFILGISGSSSGSVERATRHATSAGHAVSERAVYADSLCFARGCRRERPVRACWFTPARIAPVTPPRIVMPQTCLGHTAARPPEDTRPLTHQGRYRATTLTKVSGTSRIV